MRTVINETPTVGAVADAPSMSVEWQSQPGPNLITDATGLGTLTDTTTPAFLLVGAAAGNAARKLTPTGWGLSNLLASVPAGRVPFADVTGLQTSNAGLTFDGTKLFTPSIQLTRSTGAFIEGNSPAYFQLINQGSSPFYLDNPNVNDIIIRTGAGYTTTGRIGPNEVMFNTPRLTVRQVSGVAGTNEMRLGHTANGSYIQPQAGKLYLGTYTNLVLNSTLDTFGSPEAAFVSSFGWRLRSNFGYAWSANSNPEAAADTELTRSSAGFVGIGSPSNKVVVGHDGTDGLVTSSTGLVRVGRVSVLGSAGNTQTCFTGTDTVMWSGANFGWANTNSASTLTPLDTGLARDSAGTVRVTNGSTGYGSLIANQLQFTASGGAGGLGGLYLNDAASNAVRIRSSLGNPQLNIAGSAGTTVLGNGRLGLGSTHTITFHSNTDGSGSGDTRLRRSSANTLDLDTGTDGAFGDLRLRNLTASGTINVPGGSNTNNGISTTAQYMTYVTQLGNVTQYGNNLYSLTGVLGIGPMFGSFGANVGIDDASGSVYGSDWRIRRTGVKTVTFDDRAGGAATLGVTGNLTASGTVSSADFLVSGAAGRIRNSSANSSSGILLVASGDSYVYGQGGNSVAHFITGRGIGVTSTVGIGFCPGNADAVFADIAFARLDANTIEVNNGTATASGGALRDMRLRVLHVTGGTVASFTPTVGNRPRTVLTQGSSAFALMSGPIDGLSVAPLGTYSTRTGIALGGCTSLTYGDNWFSASARRAGGVADSQGGGWSQGSWYFELGRVSDGAAGAFVVGNNHASATGNFQRQWYSHPGNLVFCGFTSTTDRESAAIQNAWADSTDATRTGRLLLSVYSTTTPQEGIRIDANSGGVRLGFYGATAVARPTLPDAGTVTAADIRTALISLGLCQ